MHYHPTIITERQTEREIGQVRDTQRRKGMVQGQGQAGSQGTVGPVRVG